MLVRPRTIFSFILVLISHHSRLFLPPRPPSLASHAFLSITSAARSRLLSSTSFTFAFSLSLSRSLQLSHTLPNHSIGTSTFDSRKRKHSRRPLSRDSLPPPPPRPPPTSLATHLHASFIAAASSSTSALIARTVVCGREVVRGLGTQPALTSRRSGRVRYHPRESTTSPYESPLSGVHSGGAIFLNFCESILVS